MMGRCLYARLRLRISWRILVVVVAVDSSRLEGQRQKSHMSLPCTALDSMETDAGMGKLSTAIWAADTSQRKTDAMPSRRRP